MMQTGSEFFVLQIAGLVVFNSDNLIVTHYLGPAQVAPYSVAWRLVGYASIAQTLISPALWPAFSEAFARGDFQWVRSTFRRTMWLTMSTTLALCVVFRMWLPHDHPHLGQQSRGSHRRVTLVDVRLGDAEYLYEQYWRVVLVAKGKTQLLAWCGADGGGHLNIGLSIYWVKRIGAPGVILGTIVSYLVVLVIPQTMSCYYLLRKMK